MTHLLFSVSFFFLSIVRSATHSRVADRRIAKCKQDPVRAGAGPVLYDYEKKNWKNSIKKEEEEG